MIQTLISLICIPLILIEGAAFARLSGGMIALQAFAAGTYIFAQLVSFVVHNHQTGFYAVCLGRKTMLFAACLYAGSIGILLYTIHALGPMVSYIAVGALNGGAIIDYAFRLREIRRSEANWGPHRPGSLAFTEADPGE